MEKKEIIEIDVLVQKLQQAQDQLRQVQNECKILEQKKNFYEVKNDQFSENIKRYNKFIIVFEKRRNNTKEVYSQFDIASQCYERVLKIYEDTYFQDAITNDPGIIFNKKNEEIVGNTDQVQVENDTKRIEEQQKYIDGLLKELCVYN